MKNADWSRRDTHERQSARLFERVRMIDTGAYARPASGLFEINWGYEMLRSRWSCEGRVYTLID